MEESCCHSATVNEVVEYGHDRVTRCVNCGKEVWRESNDSLLKCLKRIEEEYSDMSRRVLQPTRVFINDELAKHIRDADGNLPDGFEAMKNIRSSRAAIRPPNDGSWSPRRKHR